MDFVFVHGTTQSPAGWDRLAAVLRARGHIVTTVDLPTDQPELSVAGYARLAAGQTGPPQDRRVVVAHSGSGVLLPALAQAARAAAIAWLAAYVPDLTGGRSMLADIQHDRDAMFHPDWLGVNPVGDPQLAIRFLFHDYDPQTQQWALGTLRLFDPGPAVYQHTPGPVEPRADRSCILPTADRTLQPGWMRRAARERMGIEPVEICAGHCPHVSQPESIAAILTRA